MPYKEEDGSLSYYQEAFLEILEKNPQLKKKYKKLLTNEPNLDLNNPEVKKFMEEIREKLQKKRSVLV